MSRQSSVSVRSSRPLTTTVLVLASATLLSPDPAKAGSDTKRRPEDPTTIDVFVSGKEDIFEFRIPSLVTTTKGTLIAMCDGRVRRAGDLPNDINLVMKRSLDRGKTWTKLQTICDFPDWEGAGDPSMVVDRQTATIWAFYDYGVPASQRRRKRALFAHVIKSDDDGKTWSKPVDLTPTLCLPGYEALLIGPGMGIQMRDGTLLMPTYSLDTNGKHCSQLVYSGDHGKTWKIGPKTETHTNEPQVVELADGRLMMNMRCPRGTGKRAVVTADGIDRPWTPLAYDATLIEPGCQASFIRYTAKGDGYAKNRLLFCNPASTKHRVKMTVRLSYDEGKTWPISKVIYSGPSSYSCLTVLPDATIGLLYEVIDPSKGRVGRIRFARFSLEWLTDSKDTLSKGTR